MKTLLIGGSRFVGAEIAWKLLESGHDLTIMSLDSPPAELRRHVEWLQVNRDSPEALCDTFAGRTFDHVVDNIAYVPDHLRPVLAALDGRIGRYLMTGTTDVYPKNFPRMWHEEDIEIRDYDLADLNSYDRYNLGKRSCQALLAASGVPWTVLRPCSVTGPRDNLSGSPAGRGLHWFEQSGRSHFWISRVRDGGPILLFADDENVFNLVWVGDVARAAVHLLSRADTIGEAYNVVGDELWTNERLVRALARAAGREVEIVKARSEAIGAVEIDYGTVHGSGASWSIYDNQKLKATGWLPTPAESWLPDLFHAEPEIDYRGGYHTRLQEIAIARHRQRHRTGTMHPAPQLFTRAVLPAPSGAAHATLTELIPGRCTPEASSAWRERFQMRTPDAPLPRCSDFDGRTVSKVGVGTWMGGLDGQTSAAYLETLVYAVARGLNVIDTAINYRSMLAERVVGQAVRKLTALGIGREALFVTSKGGFITHDAGDPRAPALYREQEYVESGLITAAENERSHSLAPAYIDDQISRSRRNLGLETIDMYFLHNPEEEIPHVGRARFYELLQEAFVVLERRVAAGHIAGYGLATWEAFRARPDHPKYISIAQAASAAQRAAKRVGNRQPGLRAVQLPFNVQDRKPLTFANQAMGKEQVPALEACRRLGLHVFTSGTLMQGATPPAWLDGLAPGRSRHAAALAAVVGIEEVGTALVGMRSTARVDEALSLPELTRPAREVFSLGE
jgi:aryl-alcohol dehydrogenase-like predicted oxidoreductase/nucleoside-diphosphate-sugar epimerase